MEEKRFDRLFIDVWKEFKILRNYNKARLFRTFVLQTSVLKGFAKNIEHKRVVKEKKKLQQKKVEYFVKKRYFAYLKYIHIQREKY
jgi:hypothetical protein